jgi:hypothetical protein
LAAMHLSSREGQGKGKFLSCSPVCILYLQLAIIKGKGGGVELRAILVPVYMNGFGHITYFLMAKPVLFLYLLFVMRI